tara:strand:+ start:34229 stop:34339 length:111 start_codon:yes stop_codon:yes gene_type:complete
MQGTDDMSNTFRQNLVKINNTASQSNAFANNRMAID